MITKAAIGFAGLLQLLLLAPLTAADKSPACTEGFPKPVEWSPEGEDTRIFRVNDRNVRVVTPKNYKKNEPSPMIIAFHDKEQAPETFEYDTNLFDPAINEDMIVVYPAAINVKSDQLSLAARI
jgi:poly(3-hydroxybutyrate) depolymerase